jgi:ribosomal protein S16
MKKIILYSVGVIGILVLMGCGESANNEQQNIPEDKQNVKIDEPSNKSILKNGSKVTKEASEIVRTELEKMKKKALEIQMDKSLSKEEKAEQLSALQGELQAALKDKMDR